MRSWDAARVAQAAEAELLRAGRPAAGGPGRTVIDSRAAGPGDLFVGIAGERADGGSFAGAVLAAGAWGALATPSHARAATAGADPGATGEGASGAILAHPDPTAALGNLARAWRRALGAKTIGVTGSTGKTSTKDILAALLAPHRAVSWSRENFNTEIGLPLTVLEAPPGTDALVLEMAMRGAGQIAELTDIAEPDVGLITNVGPVHLELLGSLDAIAAAKAELIAGLPAGATAIVPAGEARLESHRRSDVDWVTFGEGGDVALAERSEGSVVIDARGTRIELQPAFTAAYHQENLLAAVACAQAIGVTPSGPVNVTFSSLRGDRIELARGVVVINDCYNANPMSMRAALDDLAATAPGRRVGVLGDMLELGPDAEQFHAEAGAQAAAAGVGLLITVGPLAAAMAAPFGGESRSVATALEAAAMAAELLEPGDTVLVKASRGVGLEAVAETLRERDAA
jgi:UDP-N-acetylmuramoyl-tripeptide--D-alanyl-D-alanine ligase